MSGYPLGLPDEVVGDLAGGHKAGHAKAKLIAGSAVVKEVK